MKTKMPCGFGISTLNLHRDHSPKWGEPSHPCSLPAGNSVTHLKQPTPQGSLQASSWNNIYQWLLLLPRGFPQAWGLLLPHPGVHPFPALLGVADNITISSAQNFPRYWKTAFLCAHFNQQKHRRFQSRCFLSLLTVSWAGGPVKAVLLDKSFNQGFHSWIWVTGDRKGSSAVKSRQQRLVQSTVFSPCFHMRLRCVLLALGTWLA